VVSISFVADGEGTQMTAVHDRLPAQVESHGGGWGQILDNLVRVLGEEVAWTSP
jgi:hypothetical protein